MALALFSCSRDLDGLPVNKNIEGNWRMVLVKVNSTGFMHTKPGAVTGDVDITFVAATPGKGFINGRTPSQPIEAEYELSSPDGMKIPVITYGKIAETSWGLDFLYNIISADTWSIEQDGKLRIHTANKTLYFERN